MATFSLGEHTYPADEPAPNIFVFLTWMAAVVSKHRGGQNSAYLPECADFMADVVGERLSVSDPLPDAYDWRPCAAVECAEAMLEYDDA